MWHIAKREIYDNLNSLRFALTTVLLLALMVTNAVRHLREHPKHVQRYREAVAESLNHLTTRAEESLYTLAQYGPGNFYKKPSPLHFCANGSEPILPDMVEVNKPVVFGTIGTSDSYEEKGSTPRYLDPVLSRYQPPEQGRWTRRFTSRLGVHHRLRLKFAGTLIHF